MTKLVVVLALVAACTSASSTGITSASLTCDTTLTYDNFGSAFFENNCLSCHATQEQPRLTTQAAIQSNASRILDEAVYTTAMPQDADIATAERQMLGDWLVCGAP
jgi:uncharacterized membrane protein|nr:hypothetical protein [Kofleriaceae bacterium]